MEKERVNNYTKRLWNAKHTTEIRSILKEFEFECASQKPSTSDEALPIGDVSGNEVACDHPTDKIRLIGSNIICLNCKKTWKEIA